MEAEGAIIDKREHRLLIFNGSRVEWNFPIGN